MATTSTLWMSNLRQCIVTDEMLCAAYYGARSHRITNHQQMEQCLTSNDKRKNHIQVVNRYAQSVERFKRCEALLREAIQKRGIVIDDEADACDVSIQFIRKTMDVLQWRQRQEQATKAKT